MNQFKHPTLKYVVDDIISENTVIDEIRNHYPLFYCKYKRTLDKVDNIIRHKKAQIELVNDILRG